METDTNDSDAFIKQDIKQELSCCSCYFEDIIIKIMNIEDNENEADINNPQCKECFERAKGTGVFLPCEAIGVCIKNEKEFRRLINAL